MVLYARNPSTKMGLPVGSQPELASETLLSPCLQVPLSPEITVLVVISVEKSRSRRVCCATQVCSRIRPLSQCVPVIEEWRLLGK